MPTQPTRPQSKIHHVSTVVLRHCGPQDNVRYARYKRMSTVRDAMRNGLLLEALGKPVDLNAVDWHVRHRNPSAPPSEVQNQTLELIRDVVSEGLFRLGSVSEKDDRFVAWRRSLDHSIHKISHLYVKHYDDPERWMFSAWLSLTAKGEELAQCLEDKDIDLYRHRDV